MENSENLADSFLQPEPKEYSQELVSAIELRGVGWIDVKVGTLELSFGEDGPADVVFSVERVDGQFEEGALSDITGLRSLDG